MPVPLPILSGITVQAVIATIHTCVRHPAGNPRAAIRHILFFVLEYALRTSTSASTLPHVRPLRFQTGRLSAPPTAVSTHTALVWRVYCIPLQPISLARWASLGCPLSVSAHPVLMGAFPVSRKHTSLGTLTYILCRRMYSTSSRLALAHSSGSSHPPLLSSQCHSSHALNSRCSPDA